MRIVSAPTRMASTCPRSRCACRREAGEVSQRPLEGGAVRRPSRLMPHFAITNGRPVWIHLLKGSLSSEHGAANTPVRTWRPAFVEQFNAPAGVALDLDRPRRQPIWRGQIRGSRLCRRLFCLRSSRVPRSHTKSRFLAAACQIVGGIPSRRGQPRPADDVLEQRFGRLRPGRRPPRDWGSCGRGPSAPPSAQPA